MNSTSVISSLVKRELKVFFSSPMAYIVMITFLVPVGIFFFLMYFVNNQAEMRIFFDILPFVLTFIIPAITMRLFSEERHTGSLEMLLTLPVTTLDVVIAKFISALIFVLVMLAPTLVYMVTVILTGAPDAGPLVGGYIGLIFLAGSYISVGLLASALSRNQIIAFIIGFIMLLIPYAINHILSFIPDLFQGIVFFSTDYHFKSIARGIIDSQDLVYFITVIVLFLLATVKVVEERR